MIVVLLWLLALVLMVVVCWFVVLFLLGQQRPKKTQKNNKTPCFVVFFAVVITGLWPQKSQQPNAIKKNIFNFFLSEKAPFCRKKRLVLCCSHFFGVSCFFFCLILRSHFERRFRDHKTARPLFKLVFEGLKF